MAVSESRSFLIWPALAPIARKIASSRCRSVIKIVSDRKMPVIATKTAMASRTYVTAKVWSKISKMRRRKRLIRVNHELTVAAELRPERFAYFLGGAVLFEINRDAVDAIVPPEADEVFCAHVNDPLIARVIVKDAGDRKTGAGHRGSSVAGGRLREADCGGQSFPKSGRRLRCETCACGRRRRRRSEIGTPAARRGSLRRRRSYLPSAGGLRERCRP